MPIRYLSILGFILFNFQTFSSKLLAAFPQSAFECSMAISKPPSKFLESNESGFPLYWLRHVKTQIARNSEGYNNHKMLNTFDSSNRNRSSAQKARDRLEGLEYDALNNSYVLTKGFQIQGQ